MKKIKGDRYTLGLLGLLLLIVISMSLIGPRFATMSNFQSMLTQLPEYGILSLGVMIVMMTGGFDLSVVGIANLVAILAALFIRNNADVLDTGKFILIFLMAFVTGIACGVLNGILVSMVKIPPMLATLGTSELFIGICVIITDGKAVSGLPVAFSNVLTYKLMHVIPVSAVIFIILAAIMYFLLTRTSYGEKVYMIGTNEKAARFSGLDTSAVLIRTYAISGALSGMAGLIMLANYNSAKADYGSTYVMQCILICVLGGINPNGGFGKVPGVLLAVFILQASSSGLNMFPQVSSFYRPLIWGVLLLGVMIINYYIKENKQRSRV